MIEPRRALDRLVLAAIAAATSCAAIAIVLFARDHWDSLYDDSFIYLRYARNLHAGCGLRFNCGGVAVEGFTGPLYLAVLWAGGFVTDRLIALCQVVGTASLIAAAALAITAAARLGRTRRLAIVLAAATGVVLALDPFAKLYAVIGLETALAALAFSGVLLAALTERPRALLVAVTAGMLLRPEGALFVVALPLLPCMRRARWLIAAVAIVVAIVVARLAIFGTLVPNTYVAKSGGTSVHFALGAAYIRDAIVDFPLAFAAPLALLLPRGPARAAAVLVLAVAGGWLVFFMRSGGDLFEYSRLIFPLVPALSALALVGIAEGVARVRRASPLAPALAVAIVAALVGVRAAIVHDIPPQHANERVVLWAATGTYLRAHFPHQLIATVPIGAIGYYSGLPILDLVGLTDPEIARAGRGVPPDLLTKMWIGHERNDTEYVLARAPAVIVTTMHRPQPWRALDDTRAGFYADWLLLQEIKAGRAPYHVYDAEVVPGDHVLMFAHD